MPKIVLPIMKLWTLTLNSLQKLVNIVRFSELSNGDFRFLIRLDGKFTFNLKFMSRDHNFPLKTLTNQDIFSRIFWKSFPSKSSFFVVVSTVLKACKISKPLICRYLERGEISLKTLLEVITVNTASNFWKLFWHYFLSWD